MYRNVRSHNKLLQAYVAYIKYSNIKDKDDIVGFVSTLRQFPFCISLLRLYQENVRLFESSKLQNYKITKLQDYNYSI